MSDDPGHYFGNFIVDAMVGPAPGAMAALPPSAAGVGGGARTLRRKSWGTIPQPAVLSYSGVEERRSAEIRISRMWKPVCVEKAL